MKHQQLVLGILSVAIVATVTMGTNAAQAPSAQPNALSSFDVASIKRSKNAPAARVRPLPGGRVDALAVTVKDLIRTAYAADGINTAGQIEGPNWTASDRFDVQAKATGLSADSTEPNRQIAVMLQALLADRFKLKLRIDQRELPLFDLVVHRTGQLGPTLTKSSCTPAGPTAEGAGRPCEGALRSMGGPLGANGITMEALAAALGVLPVVARPVHDRTGLAGYYDVRLNPNADPNIFTALQEQLGLRLQSGKGPVSVAVIESVAPPVED
jgi:uncharacterized protein (TIGR03435 family)